MSRVDHSALARRVRIAEVLLAVIVVVGAIVVTRMIVAGPLFASTTTVHLDLPEAAGLHPRSDVSYRGQHIGSVTAIEITGSGVRATLELEGDVDVPRDSRFVVANLSAVGEQYVDIRPRTAAGPYLADGATVAAGSASLPTPTWQVLADTQRMLRRIDSDDLRTIAHEVRAMLGDGSVDLRGLVVELEKTLGTMERLTPGLLRLLDDAEAPLRTFAELGPDVRALATSARAVTAQLARANPVIARLLDQGATLVPVVMKDFDSATPLLVRMLDDGAPVAAMARAHLPGLLHWYRWTGPQLSAMADATRDGSGHVILVLTGADNCYYGPDVSPYQEKAPLPTDARCHTNSPHIQQRGAQNVPTP